MVVLGSLWTDSSVRISFVHRSLIKYLLTLYYHKRAGGQNACCIPKYFKGLKSTSVVEVLCNRYMSGKVVLIAKGIILYRSQKYTKEHHIRNKTRVLLYDTSDYYCSCYSPNLLNCHLFYITCYISYIMYLLLNNSLKDFSMNITLASFTHVF